jgi:hypothetical protein
MNKILNKHDVSLLIYAHLRDLNKGDAYGTYSIELETEIGPVEFTCHTGSPGGGYKSCMLRIHGWEVLRYSVTLNGAYLEVFPNIREEVYELVDFMSPGFSVEVILEEDTEDSYVEIIDCSGEVITSEGNYDWITVRDRWVLEDLLSIEVDLMGIPIERK